MSGEGRGGARRLEWTVDPVIAAAVSALGPNARRLLDSHLIFAPQTAVVAAAGWEAHATEMRELPNVAMLKVEWRRARPHFSLHFRSGVRWEGHRLVMPCTLPNTVVAAFRLKPLRGIADHPLFEGVVVSSARKEDAQRIVIEARRRPETRISEIVSTGADTPLELYDTLRALGLVEVCRVASEAIRRLGRDQLQSLLDRLCACAATGRTDIPILDVFGHPPSGIMAMSLHFADGALTTSCSFHNGRFRTGRMTCHGGSRSLATCFSSGMFPLYMGIGPGYSVRKPVRPTWTVDEMQRDDARRRELAALAMRAA
jgi:hypothetical protein